MKKTFKTIALVSVLALVAVGCQKEEFAGLTVESQTIAQNAKWQMQYSVDGTVYRTALYSDAEYKDFIYRMLSLAEQGFRVSFFDESKPHQTFAAKDVYTFETTDKDSAFTWASKMEDDGYIVSVSFDTKTGTYICVAYN